jgi:hypothetical protein
LGSLGSSGRAILAPCGRGGLARPALFCDCRVFAREIDPHRSTLVELIRVRRRKIERFSATSPGTTAAQRRRAAIAAHSAMVGALVLARIVDDEELSEEILGATRRSIELE